MFLTKLSNDMEKKIFVARLFIANKKNQLLSLLMELEHTESAQLFYKTFEIKSQEAFSLLKYEAVNVNHFINDRGSLIFSVFIGSFCLLLFIFAR